MLTSRALTIELVGVDAVDHVLAWAGRIAVELGTVDLTGGLSVRFTGVRLRAGDVAAGVFALLEYAEIDYDLKSRVMDVVAGSTGTALAAALHAADLPGNLYGALLEIVSTEGAP